MSSVFLCPPHQAHCKLECAAHVAQHISFLSIHYIERAFIHMLRYVYTKFAKSSVHLIKCLILGRNQNNLVSWQALCRIFTVESFEGFQGIIDKHIVAF